MTASDLENLIIARLVREQGGNSQSWRRALGRIRVRDAATHAHCNWEITAGGSERQRAAIEDLLDSVRLDQPVVTPG
jgi:hypothetical protein